MQKLIWTNSNGDSIDLTSGNYGITNWEGFSNTSLNIQSQQVPFQDGSVFLDALMEQRELSVTLAMQDNNDLQKRYQLRRELIHILNPKLGEGYLIYKNDYTSKRIKCIPQIPLFETHNSDMAGTPKASLSWTACEPFWEDVEERQVLFSVGETPIVTNDGEFPAQVEVEFFGTSESSEIKNISTGKKLKVNHAIGDGIVINTNNGQKSVEGEKFNFVTESSGWTLKSITYGKGLFVAVGLAGTILTSKDGVRWVKKSGIEGNFENVTFSSELNVFVAVGSFNTMISSDGIVWTDVQMGYYNHFYSVIYSDELNIFVVVGEQGLIYTSSDGINWDNRVSGTSNNLYSVVYAEELNLIVAVGAGGVIITSSDGVTWSSVESGVSYSLNSITYSPDLDLFVAVGSGILTSSDGETWTVRDNNKRGISVIYSEGLSFFIMLGVAENRQRTIYSSKDGINWITRSILNENFLSLTYLLELNLIIATGKAGTITTSVNAVEWETKIQGVSYQGFSIELKSLTYSERQKILVAVGSRTTAISTDGRKWTTYNNDYYFRDIIYSEDMNLFVAVGGDGILTSANGVNWTVRKTITDKILYSVVYVTRKHLFIAVGRGGSIFTSLDGLEWIDRSVEGETFSSITYSPDLDLFVAVGSGILTSSDGISWVKRSNIQKMSITYSGKLHLFVAIDGNEVATSSDGVIWVSRTTGILHDAVYTIAWSEELGCFVAVGEHGTVIISYDGKIWKRVTSDTSSRLLKVIYVDALDCFVAVGEESTILNSEFQLSENLIQYLTQDSDMSFNLQTGNNQLQLVRNNGSLQARLKYRQKYIGV